MGMDNVSIDAVHRLPKKIFGAAHGSSPRTIIAQLSRAKDKDKTLRNSWKLKNSNIFVNDDVCENTLIARQKLIPKLKEAKAAGKIAYFRSKELIIRDRKRQFTLNDHTSSRNLSPSPRRNVSDLVNVFTPQNQDHSTQVIDEPATSSTPPPSPLAANSGPNLRSRQPNSDN